MQKVATFRVVSHTNAFEVSFGVEKSLVALKVDVVESG
jgi:uncharacterized membrane protein